MRLNAELTMSGSYPRFRTPAVFDGCIFFWQIFEQDIWYPRRVQHQTPSGVSTPATVPIADLMYIAL